MFAVFAQHPALWLASALFIGLAVGSFLNVVIHRLPQMLERQWRLQCAQLNDTPLAAETYTLARPRSHCPACKTPIRVRDNVPLLGWLLLRGRCAACGVRIPWRYPLVEAITAAVAVFLAWHYGPGWQAVMAFVLSAALIALIVIDLEHQLLPDAITLPLLWLGLIVGLFGLYTDLRSAVIGAVAGYLCLWLVFQLFRLATGKEGMGYGDFKLMAVAGAWLGWQGLPLVILLSSLVGAVVGIGLLLGGRHGRDQPMPFGPFIGAALWLALLWGDMVTARYWDWLSGTA